MSDNKIDKALGLENGKSFDDFLAELNVDSKSDVADATGKIDDKVKEKVAEIDGAITQYKANGVQAVDVAKVENSLTEIKELIDASKDIIVHVRDSIKSTDLVDPELVESFAQLIKSSHAATKEYINLYQQRVKFYDQIRLEMMKHEQRKELLQMKHDLDMQSVKKVDATDGRVAFSQEDIINVLDERDKANANAFNPL